MNKLSSSDRSSLIRLTSSLPAGEEKRKAILAGLAGKTASSKTAAQLKGGPPPSETVELTIGGGRGPDILKLKVPAGQLQEYNDFLDDMYKAMGGDDFQDRYQNKLLRSYDAQRALRDAKEALEEIENELRPLLAKANKLRIDVSKFKDADMHHLEMGFIDNSGQKWVLDGGEDWVQE